MFRPLFNRPLNKRLFSIPNCLMSNTFFQLKNKSCTNSTNNIRRSSFFSMNRAIQITMFCGIHIRHGSSTRHGGNAIVKQVFFCNQNTWRSRSTNKFMRRKKDGIFVCKCTITILQISSHVHLNIDIRPCRCKIPKRKRTIAMQQNRRLPCF